PVDRRGPPDEVEEPPELLRDVFEIEGRIGAVRDLQRHLLLGLRGEAGDDGHGAKDGFRLAKNLSTCVCGMVWLPAKPCCVTSACCCTARPTICPDCTTM